MKECYRSKGHPKSKTILKSDDWFKKYGHVNWGIANRWDYPGDEASSVVYTTKKIPHTGDTESLDRCG